MATQKIGSFLIQKSWDLNYYMTTGAGLFDLCNTQMCRLMKKAGVEPSHRMRMSVFKTKPNSRHVKIWLRKGRIGISWGTTKNISGYTHLLASLMDEYSMKTGIYYLTFTPIA